MDDESTIRKMFDEKIARDQPVVAEQPPPTPDLQQRALALEEAAKIAESYIYHNAEGVACTTPGLSIAQKIRNAKENIDIN